MRQPRRVSRHLARQPFGTRRIVRCPSSRTRQGSLLVPHDMSRHDLVPATPGPARQARGPSRALAALLAVGGTPPPRALPRMWRTVPCDASSTAYAAALQHGTGAALIAAFTRRALRPGHVACGDRCVRGTIPPRHHAGINDQQSPCRHWPQGRFCRLSLPLCPIPHPVAGRGSDRRQPRRTAPEPPPAAPRAQVHRAGRGASHRSARAPRRGRHLRTSIARPANALTPRRAWGSGTCAEVRTARSLSPRCPGEACGASHRW